MNIWDVALGFQDAQILLTAEQMGVFNRLEEGPATVEDVAEAARLPEDSAGRLLSALCALEVVEKRDGRYVNAAEASEQLVRGKPGYIGAMFPYLKDVLYPVWQHFDDALREGKAQWVKAFPEQESPTEDMYDNPQALRAFMEGMHAITYEAAAEFASGAPEVRKIGSLVDVGGASGAFVIALAEVNPDLRGTVYDLPPVRPITEDFFRRSGMEDRLAFHEGNFWEEEIPSGADAYSLGFILHDWDNWGGDQILGRIASAASEGSRLIIGEYLLNDEKTGPLHVARADLNMLASARGRERSAKEYADWIARFGYEMERIHPTSKGKNFMIARKCAG